MNAVLASCLLHVHTLFSITFTIFLEQRYVGAGFSSCCAAYILTQSIYTVTSVLQGYLCSTPPQTNAIGLKRCKQAGALFPHWCQNDRLWTQTFLESRHSVVKHRTIWNCAFFHYIKKNTLLLFSFFQCFLHRRNVKCMQAFKNTLPYLQETTWLGLHFLNLWDMNYSTSILWSDMYECCMRDSLPEQLSEFIIIITKYIDRAFYQLNYTCGGTLEAT